MADYEGAEDVSVVARGRKQANKVVGCVWLVLLLAEHVDDAFFKVLVDAEEESNQINEFEVRDAFLEFM